MCLVLPTLQEVRASLDALSEEEKAQVSADWLARVRAADAPDPWVHGFDLVLRDDGVSVGSCAFKGPPTPEGVVEIAYHVDPDRQGRGYATEAARALTDYALQQDGVSRVCAHTLPEANASTRVLTKCGYKHVGEFNDPDDGPVWRWEKA